MNRLVLAALALVAVGGGAYYFVMTRPAVGPGEGAPPLPATGVVEPSAVSTPRAELVDPKLSSSARTQLERSQDPAVGAPTPEKTASQQPKASPAPNAGPPAIPWSLPPIPDADEGALLEKYGNATPEERRQALESLTLTYKDAASGRIKNSEQLLKELEIEMQWLEGHLDP